MEPPIPLKGVVLFIAFGTMVFILVFCFIKRQITRFTLRSSHVPHAAIGANVPKSLKAEIEQKLRRVKEISCEPRLLMPGMEERVAEQIAADPRHYIHRMKTVDALAILDGELRRCGLPLTRKPSTPLKLYLLDARQTGRPLDGARLDLVERFANIYEQARHDAAEFTVVQYEEFMSLLQQLLDHIRSRCHQSTAVDVSGRDNTAGGADDVQLKHSSSKTASLSAGFNIQFTSPVDASQAAAQQRIANYAVAGVVVSPTDTDNKTTSA